MTEIILCAGSARADAAYKRMLTLELELAGFRVLRESEYASVAVIDLDSAVEPYPSAELLIGYGRGEQPAPEGFRARFSRPFHPSELIELIRSCDNAPPPVQSGAKEALPVTARSMDGKYFAAVGEARIELTKREFELLSYLLRSCGRPVSRSEALSEAWEQSGDEPTNLVDVYIRYLRQKLDERYGVRFIKTVRGQGYMIDSPAVIYVNT